ncbi:Cullin homology [Tylopilus felleus]
MASNAVRAQVAAKWQESFARINRAEPGISGLMSFSHAWTLATAFLKPYDLNDPTPRPRHDMRQVREAFDIINKCRRLPVMLEVFLEDLHKSQHLIAREVEVYMNLYESNSDPETVRALIFRLVEWYNAWKPNVELGQTITSAYTLAFQTYLFAILPPSFVRGVKALVAATLVRTVSQPSDQQDRSLWQAFETLSLIERYETLIASVGYEYIEAHVLQTCAGSWAEPMLANLRGWMIQKIVPWMVWPFARGATSADEAKTMMQGVGSRFDFHMHKTLCDLRTREIFDIIVDFPDSVGALQDLKECLQRVDQRADLVHSIRQANRKRLLHPGADTKDILLSYVSTIKCLRIVDPAGVLLFKVADPIRRYLRDRPDAIRCIVASLVGDGESGDSLVDDNEPIQPLQQPEIENYADPEWTPEPIDAGPDFRASKTSDIISTIVSIYDSKDLFIKELQVLLAQRLLAIKDGNFDRERRNIEILKIRFGESALQVCEVMLRDMTDSRRIDQHVQSQRPSVVHPTIISRHFWPALETSSIVMPGQFQEAQEQYAKEFTTFKPDKTLCWLPHLGRVQLELEFDDRTVNADVPPLEAAFIELFSEKDTWTVDELISRVGSVSRTAALKALATWVDMRVLKEDSEHVFKLLSVEEEPTPGTKTTIPKLATGEDELAPMMSVQQQQAEQMKVYWKFIEGMLTNLGSLPLDRIQTMLRLAPGYNRTIEQLASFMEAAKREGLATVKDGMWRLGK